MKKSIYTKEYLPVYHLVREIHQHFVPPFGRKHTIHKIKRYFHNTIQTTAVVQIYYNRCEVLTRRENITQLVQIPKGGISKCLNSGMFLHLWVVSLLCLVFFIYDFLYICDCNKYHSLVTDRCRLLTLCVPLQYFTIIF